MKQSKKLLALFLATITASSLVACGGGEPVDSGDGEKGKKIVIYTGGSSEYSTLKGELEDQAIEAVEEKYYQDTNVKLDFEVAYLGLSMQESLTYALSGGDQVDMVISHTRGGVGVDDYMLKNECYTDITDYLDVYGANIYDSVPDRAFTAVTTSTNEIIGLPSVISPYKYGILVRKDYMREAGYTDVESEVTNEIKLLETISDFEDMCIKIKQNTGFSYAITGAVWDMEKLMLSGAYNQSAYFINSEVVENGEVKEVIPGWLKEEYKDVLALEYRWSKELGITSGNENNMSVDLTQANFILGKTGVYCTDGTIQKLISVARKTKAQNPNAEFTVIGPLPKEKGGEKGFMQNSEATFMAGFVKTSNNTGDLIKFINWMYSDEENYKLCKYGIDGVHYVDNGDGTYSYPQGKESYLYTPAYSGVLAFVENQNVCDMTYAGYTAEENSWINNVSKNKENYIFNPAVYYLLPMSKALSRVYDNAKNGFYDNVALPAWMGTQNPSSVIASGTSSARSALTDYLTQATQVYKILKQRNPID